VSSLADLFAARYLTGAGGIDFAPIRLHPAGTGPASRLSPGSQAGRLARALRARAFTVGSDIYFADGAFAPHTREGLWLLAHEVAHVVQQSVGAVPVPSVSGRPMSAPPTSAYPATSGVIVVPPGTAEERAADAAAGAFLAGRPFVFGPPSRPSPQDGGALTNPPLVVQRYMAWEHSLLGDVAPEEIEAMTASAPAGPGTRAERIAAYCDLLEALAHEPRDPDEARLAAGHPGLTTLRLPGSGLVVTLGELNVLPDYLGHPDEVEKAPAAFLKPLLQSVRSWSIAELSRPVGLRRRPRLLPGALRYPLLGPLAETAEIGVVGRLGERCGFAPDRRYPSVLARNAGHFAPFSWHRWHAFHQAARELIERSATAEETERERLRRRALIHAGYADHFLQDSFAAGHQINKTLVMQWYIEFLAARGVQYPDRDVLDALTAQRQPELHGPARYDRGQAPPGPPWDPEDLALVPNLAERVEFSGVTGDGDPARRQAYAAYLAMQRSGTVSLAAKVAHEHLNEHSLVVSAGPDGPPFRLYGDHTLLAGSDGTMRAARAAAASRQAIAELLRDGRTAIGSQQIMDLFPSHVALDGRLITLQEWHDGALRDLCFGDLFQRPSTRLARLFMSTAFRSLGTPASD